MSYIEESLSEGERVIERFSHHWTAYVAIWLCVIPFGVLVIPLLLALYLWMNLRSMEQGLTSKRAVLKTGIIGRSTEEMRLPKIETVEIRQSIWGRLFGFGDVKLTGQGVSDLVFRGIDNPMAVKRAIENVL